MTNTTTTSSNLSSSSYDITNNLTFKLFQNICLIKNQAFLVYKYIVILIDSLTLIFSHDYISMVGEILVSGDKQ